MGFWLLGLLPVFQPPIKAGANSGWALEFAVPGARPGGQNAHFFWIGFWLLGLLPVFQPPIKAEANSGWALKFAKSTRSHSWRPKCPFFFGLVSGYWVCYQFFSVPLRREQIRETL